MLYEDQRNGAYFVNVEKGKITFIFCGTPEMSSYRKDISVGSVAQVHTTPLAWHYNDELLVKKWDSRKKAFTIQGVSKLLTHSSVYKECKEF